MDIKVIANGNSNNPAIYSTGLAPQAGDFVYANGFTISINANFTASLISNLAHAGTGAVAGGTFNTTVNNITITADITTNSTISCLNLNGSNITYIGNYLGGASASGASRAIVCSGTGNLNIIGTGTGGAAAGGPAIVPQSGVGIVTITGDLIGGSLAQGMIVNGLQPVIHNGNAISSTTMAAVGMNVPTLVYQYTLNGLAICGPGSIVAAVQNASTFSIFIIQGMEFSALGGVPVSGAVKFSNTLAATAKIYKQNGTNVTLSDPAAIAGVVPPATDVRNGVSYLSGGRTGSLKVPTPANVRKGVQTDNTVGTGEITAADLLAEIQISVHPVAERLRNCSTIQSNGEQLELILNG